MNDENIEPPAVYLKMSLVHKSDEFEKWRPTSIQKIIKNEVYIGTLLQGKTKKISYKSKKKINLPRELWIAQENAHEPIISEEIFYKAQEMLNRRKDSRDGSREYLLKGITYCHNCGNKLNFVTKTEKYKDKKYERRYAVCNKANKGKCIRQYNNYDKLEEEVLEYIRKICFLNINSEVYRKVMLENKSENINIIKDYQSHIKVLEDKILDIYKKIDKIYEDRLNEIIDEKDYLRYSNRFCNERKQIEDNIQSLKEKINILEHSEQEEISNKELKEKTKNFLKAKYINKSILFDIVNRIEIDENKQIYIYFNFKQLNIYNAEEIRNVKIS